MLIIRGYFAALKVHFVRKKKKTYNFEANWKHHQYSNCVQKRISKKFELGHKKGIKNSSVTLQHQQSVCNKVFFLYVLFCVLDKQKNEAGTNRGQYCLLYFSYTLLKSLNMHAHSFAWCQLLSLYQLFHKLFCTIPALPPSLNVCN